MRRILLAAAVSASVCTGCGGITTPEDPHTVGPCGASWGSPLQPTTPKDCEVACAEDPMATGPSCPTTTQDGTPATCKVTFEYTDGIVGCCGRAFDGSASHIYFGQCK